MLNFKIHRLSIDNVSTVIISYRVIHSEYSMNIPCNKIVEVLCFFCDDRRLPTSRASRMQCIVSRENRLHTTHTAATQRKHLHFKSQHTLLPRRLGSTAWHTLSSIDINFLEVTFWPMGCFPLPVCVASTTYGLWDTINRDSLSTANHKR